MGNLEEAVRSRAAARLALGPKVDIDIVVLGLNYFGLQIRGHNVAEDAFVSEVPVKYVEGAPRKPSKPRIVRSAALDRVASTKPGG